MGVVHADTSGMGDSVTVDLTLSAPDPRALALHTLVIDFALAYERRLPSQRLVVLDAGTRCRPAD